jgi:hypothetical protein
MRLPLIPAAIPAALARERSGTAPDGGAWAFLESAATAMMLLTTEIAFRWLNCPSLRDVTF